jgi:actinin alpha
VKLSSAGHPAYNPPEGLSTQDIQQQWDELEKAQQAREEALLAELARQQLLDLLAKRFNNKASQLEDWIKNQQDELNKEENIDNLEVAEQKLKAIEAFRQEYEQNKGRLKDLHDIKDEYCKNDGKDKEPITERANKIQSDFDALNDLVNKKAASLGDSLAKQQAMEELRKKFANAAKEYNYWVKDTVGDVSSTVFPDSLEGVENYKSELDANDSSVTSSNDEKKANLDDLWEQEKAMGITTNPYTVFTNEDVAAWHTSVNDAIAERQKAYDAELERQKQNEEKRKEFAAAAQGFVDHLDSRTKEIDGLSGEPSELIESIKSTYDEGKPEQEKLSGLSSMQEEMGKMGIMENRHTPYTLPILQVNNDNLARHVRNRISSLEQEGSLKKECNEKSRKLVDWIDATLPSIRSEFDNTLEGARAVKDKWTTYKTTDRSQRGLDRIHLETLYQNIQENQKASGRPEFVPEDDLKLENVSAKWDQMTAEEKKWEDELNAELSRQEKLFMQVKHFHSEADELEKDASKHEAFLAEEDNISSLDESRIKLMRMDVFDEDFENSSQRLNALKSRGDKIKNLKHNNASELDDRISGLENKLNSIKESAATKREALKGENDAQEKKEALRVDFANKTKDYDEFVRNVKVELDDKNFGTTLEAVEQTAAKLDESDKSYTDASNEKKAACQAASDELSNNGITDNSHTDKTMDDMNKLDEDLKSAIENRRTAYNAELERQKDHDADRKAWAEKAQAFVDYLAEQRAAIKAVDGTPEEKATKVKEIFKEGAEAQSKLEELNEMNTAMRGKGIYSNSYTPHTMLALQKRLTQHLNAVNNTLSFFDDEKEFLQREQENGKEWQKKQEVEQRRLDFEFKCKNLIMYLDSIQDTLTDPINVTSVQAVEDLQKDFDATLAQLNGDKKNEYDAILAELDALKGLDVDASCEVTTAKWDQANANAEARKQQLADALAKQQENDALCKQFADKAQNADSWLQKTSAALENASGDLEAQLQSLRDMNMDEGRAILAELNSLAEQLAAADVRSNPHTEFNAPSLRARVNEVEAGQKSKQALLEKEILSKKHSTASPEQIEEFKEVFAHFDKNHTNSLNKLEFKSCLQSLGEDPTDDQMESLMTELADDVDGSQQIGFEKFLSYMIKITSDTTTENEISAAFRDLAQDKDFITADDLRRSGMPNEKIDYLLSEMPAFEGVEGGYDYQKWAQAAFSR